jgi:hypothetical protein
MRVPPEDKAQCRFYSTVPALSNLAPASCEKIPRGLKREQSAPFREDVRRCRRFLMSSVFQVCEREVEGGARLTIFRVGCQPNPEESTCKRSLADGVLTEIIHWRGRRDQMTAENLDRFVEKFPIEPYLVIKQKSTRNVGN